MRRRWWCQHRGQWPCQPPGPAKGESSSEASTGGRGPPCSAHARTHQHHKHVSTTEQGSSQSKTKNRMTLPMSKSRQSPVREEHSVHLCITHGFDLEDGFDLEASLPGVSPIPMCRTGRSGKVWTDYTPAHAAATRSRSRRHP